MKKIRESVRKKLDQIANYPLTLICAPIGYGKTTVMKEVLKGKVVDVHWYDTKGEKWSPKVKYDKETWVVLEDYQEISGLEEYTKQICKWAKEVKEHLHIIILTRKELPLSLGELKVKGICQIIQKQELAMDKKQIKAYLGEQGLEISEDGINKVWEYTRGWPAPIALIKDLEKENYQFNSRSILYNFVEEGIYKTYDKGLQKLLLFLGGIGKFKMQDFEYHSDYKRIRRASEWLLKSNVPYEYDSSNNTYELLPIIKDYVGCRLELVEGNVEKEISREIGEWFVHRREWNRAISYFRRGKWYEQIVSCLEADELPRMGGADYTLIAQLLEELDGETKQKYPLLYLRVLYCKAVEEHKIEGVEFEQLEKIYSHRLDLSEEQKNQVYGEISLMKCIVERLDEKGIEENLEKVIKYLPEGSKIINIMDWIKIGNLNFIYKYHKEEGKLKEELKGLMERTRNNKFFYGLQSMEIHYMFKAEFYMYRGEWEQAEKYAYKLFVKGDLIHNLSMRVYGELLLARIHFARGEQTKGYKQIEEIKEYELYQKEKSLNNYITMEIIRLGYYIGQNLEETKAEKLLLLSGKKWDVGIYLHKAYQSIKDKEYTFLEIIAESMCEEIDSLGDLTVFAKIYYHIYMAIAKVNTKEKEEAESHLQKALSMSYKDHIILPFIENKKELEKILKSIMDQSPLKEYIGEILVDRTKEKSSNVYSEWNLTKREEEVIELATEGFTNKEIANQLYVAPITIAKTMSNVYRKIGASNRVEMMGILKS